jgi:hypothetical protein
MLDREIRPHFIRKVRDAHPDALLFQEFPVCRRGRADLVAINSALWGYEIKSEHDTLNRLPLQIQHYECIFDFCTAVVAERHLNYATKIVPPHWGIVSVQGTASECSIVDVRNPERNPNRKLDQIIRLLWKNEAAKALRARGVKVPSSTSVRSIWKLLRSLPEADINESVRNALKSRRVPAVAALQTLDGDLSSIAATA